MFIEDYAGAGHNKLDGARFVQIIIVAATKMYYSDVDYGCHFRQKEKNKNGGSA